MVPLMPLYESVPFVPAVTSDVVVINQRVNMANGTGWHVQTTFYKYDLIGVAIDRKGFFLFRGDDAVRTLSDPSSLTYVCEKLGLTKTDGEGMQEYYRWYFKRDFSYGVENESE